jgi:nickel-dependent lactate racemase
MRIFEHYGDKLTTLTFHDGWDIKRVDLNCEDSEVMTEDEIRGALDNTFGSSSIREQAKGKTGKIVITCDDLSRPTPANKVFPFIIEQLHEAGISDKQIFVLSSFGCHHPMNLDDFARKLGEWVVAKYDCVNHNPWRNFENLGRTSRGTPVLINKEFMSADLRICISGIKKHVWAGAGGGGKAILPGVSSIETIQYNHALIEGHRPLNRRIWWIRDNPERKDMQETARMADLNISINCVYNGCRGLIDLAAGHVDDAWKKAVKLGYEAHDSGSAPKSDVVVVNAYPQADQDIDWWGAQESLREGGTVVAVHHYPPGRALLHYRGEQAGAPWRRIMGYPNKRWPVKQAENIIVYTNRLSKRQMLYYHEKIEWITDWDKISERLLEIHGESADVAIYPCGKIQFDSTNNPLCI